MRYLRCAEALVMVGLAAVGPIGGCASQPSPPTADVAAIRARSPIVDPSHLRTTTTTITLTLRPVTDDGATPDATSGATPDPPTLLARDPLPALVAIDHAIDHRTRPLAGLLVPNATIANDVLRLFGDHTTPEYEVQSNDGTRANVFVGHQDGRAVVTLVRWNGEWLIAAVVDLETGPPTVVIES